MKYLESNIVTFSDYYPFGMLMPGRNGGSLYRYGMNGMEQDDEVSGKGNSYTTTYRKLDPRLGRWLSTDPKTASSPWHTPYQSFGNNPILMVDPKGDKEWESLKAYQDETGNDALGEYDWLTSDRKDKNEIWENAMASITKDKVTGEFEPFGQVDDYYGWVQGELDKKGHEVRWAKGAKFLVHDLTETYEIGATAGEWFGSDELKEMLGELNMAIADYAIGKFSDLLYSSVSAQKGDDAYQWDKDFIYYEQNIIAIDVYYNWKGSDALKDMNNIVNKTFSWNGIGAAFLSSVPSFTYMGESGDLNNMNTGFGEDVRTDMPLLMLYPKKHTISSEKPYYNSLAPFSTPYILNGKATGVFLQELNRVHKSIMK